MRRGQFIRRHPIAGACLLFPVLAVLCCAAAGLYLAANPGAGGWNLPRRPPNPGFVVRWHGHNELVRTPRGVQLGKPIDVPPLIAPPEGAVLGSVKFTVRIDHLHGWPRPTYEHWTISVDTIKPGPDGPPASDERAWRGLVAEAINIANLPRAALDGEADFYVWRVRALLTNPVERLRHAPAWLGGSLAAAALIAALLGARWWRRRGVPGRCTGCGYDLQGLASPVCPECGAAST